MTENRITGIIKIALLILLLACVAACDREYESVFDETPDARAQAALDEYNSLLTDAPFGWKASLYTGTGAGYFYYFDFNENGSVSMLSDFNETTAGDVLESEWVLKALQRITLSFTTYSYIHLPADPDGNINNGIPGSGLLSDFEFAFVRTSGDSVIMKGIQHDAELVLVRSTAEETQQYQDKRIQYMLQQTQTYLDAYKGYRLVLPDNSEVPMAFSISQKLISFQYLDGETIRIPTTSYTFSLDGITLKTPIRIGEFSIRELIWDDDSHSYQVPLGENITLSGSDDPFIFYPSETLHSKLGLALVTAVIPAAAGNNPLPGQSDDFTAVFNDAAQQMIDGDYRLTLEEVKFVFPPHTDRMFMVVTFTQPVSGGGVSRFTAQYTYSYQVREEGILKFNLEGTDTNAGILYMYLIGILSHFDNDTFKMEYVGGGFNLISGFFSQEEPGYYFSGYLVE